MKIRFIGTKKEQEKAFYLMITNGTMSSFKKGEFYISEMLGDWLRKKKVRFKVLEK